MRVLTGIKENYEQVGENEYNQIIPYAPFIYRIKQKYPNAKIKRFKTTTGVVSGIQYPELSVYFETE